MMETRFLYDKADEPSRAGNVKMLLLLLSEDKSITLFSWKVHNNILLG